MLKVDNLCKTVYPIEDMATTSVANDADLEKALRLLPDRIRDVECELHRLETQQASVKARMDRAEQRVWNEIVFARDEDGKKKYSNDDQRKAVFNRQVDEDGEVSDLRQQYRDLEVTIADKRIELTYEQNRLKAACAVARLRGGSD